jgi:micrococcal nuclease
MARLVMIRSALIAAMLLFSAQAHELRGKVVGVHDGDTMTLLVDKVEHKIRLDAIDAPEAKQAFGEASRKSLAAMIAGKQAVVEWQKKDRYGRIIGRVSVGGTEVNVLQVAYGMAWHFKEYNKEARFANAESTARQRKIGLWQDAAPVAPWEFRKQVKK